jgi:hypothetical protein
MACVRTISSICSGSVMVASHQSACANSCRTKGIRSWISAELAEVGRVRIVHVRIGFGPPALQADIRPAKQNGRRFGKKRKWGCRARETTPVYLSMISPCVHSCQPSAGIRHRVCRYECRHIGFEVASSEWALIVWVGSFAFFHQLGIKPQRAYVSTRPPLSGAERRIGTVVDGATLYRAESQDCPNSPAPVASAYVALQR